MTISAVTLTPCDGSVQGYQYSSGLESTVSTMKEEKRAYVAYVRGGVEERSPEDGL